MKRVILMPHIDGDYDDDDVLKVIYTAADLPLSPCVWETGVGEGVGPLETARGRWPGR